MLILSTGPCSMNKWPGIHALARLWAKEKKRCLAESLEDVGEKRDCEQLASSISARRTDDLSMLCDEDLSRIDQLKDVLRPTQFWPCGVAFGVLSRVE